MTNITPEQYRALADALEGVELALPSNTGVHIIVARDFLRTAADQLEEVQAVCDRVLSVKLMGSTTSDAAAAAVASAVRSTILTAAPRRDAMTDPSGHGCA